MEVSPPTAPDGGRKQRSPPAPSTRLSYHRPDRRRLCEAHPYERRITVATNDIYRTWTTKLTPADGEHDTTRFPVSRLLRRQKADQTRPKAHRRQRETSRLPGEYLVAVNFPTWSARAAVIDTPGYNALRTGTDSVVPLYTPAHSPMAGAGNPQRRQTGKSSTCPPQPTTDLSSEGAGRSAG